LSQAVDPDGLHNAIHPTVETRTKLELIGPFQGTFAGRLNEVIAFVNRTRESTGKTPQLRQQPQELVAERDTRTHSRQSIGKGTTILRLGLFTKINQRARRAN
jgi:hypothetical protein